MPAVRPGIATDLFQSVEPLLHVPEQFGLAHPAVVPIQDPALELFPYVTWGGRLKFAPTKGFYAQAGILKANPSLNVTNGFDCSTRNATVHQPAFELGFQSSDPKARNSLADRRLSQHLRRRRSLSQPRGSAAHYGGWERSGP